ncbi:PTPA-CTERM sorting domain-containing protein [Adonisia turfae]|nr:PTPA-CTERM sorting domain-containing protein [Adonisia turfae]
MLKVSTPTALILSAPLWIWFPHNSSASAMSLVRNGSFETGDFSGWTKTGNITLVSVPAASDGSLSAAFSFGNRPNNGILSQSLTTIVGQAYELSFDLGINGGNANFVDQFLGVEVIGSNSLVSEVLRAPKPPFGFQFPPSVFNFVADSATTLLRFSDESLVSFNVDIQLDNVSVLQTDPDPDPDPDPAPVPTPATLPGLIGMGVAAFKKRKQENA